MISTPAAGAYPIPMSASQSIPAGLTLLGPLGHGSCGESCLARDANGNLRVVKFFKAMGINRRLLMGAHARLAESEGHPGVARVLASDFDARPAWVLLDFYGEHGARGAVPCNLETWLGQLPPPDLAWKIIRQLAEALAFLHRIGVAHANLQPRNILITDPERGAIALTDFSQGWVDGVYHFEGTEALLYASPEQLREPEGIEQGVWGGWDVFAFGSLAFRLLTGRFPRADSERRQLEIRRAAGDAISPAALHGLFPGSEAPEWGDYPAAGWEENARRHILETCLALDPEVRPKDMREVLAEFDRVDEERGLRDERERVRSLRLREVRSLRKTRAIAIALGVGCALATLVAFIYSNQYRLASREVDDLKTRLGSALAEKEDEIRVREAEARRREEVARAQAAGAVRETTAIKENLIRSQEQADALFAVVKDRKPPSHPGFKDISQTATELRDFYQDFLATTPKDASMDLPRARAMGNLAELALTAEDRPAAIRWQTDAVKLWEKLSERDLRDPELRSRLGYALLFLAQADFQEGKIASSSAAVGRARGLFETLAKEKPGDTDILRNLAACYLQQGRIERQQGRTDTALSLYSAANQQLRRLTESTGRFDFRSELAAGYVEMGELARGTNDLEHAANVQRAALAQLVSMVEEKPEMLLPKLDLARAYGELGEIECEAGNPDKGQDQLNKSIAILEELLAQQPGSEEVLFQMAKRYSSLARAHRDQGRRVEAEKLVDTANAYLKRLAEAHPENSYYVYNRALSLWQKAELHSDLKQLDEAIGVMRESMNILSELSARQDLDGSQRKQVHISMAYLTGDLGHRLEEARRREDALAAFQTALKRWQDVAATYGQDEITADAVTWCTRRVEELRYP
ncbi:MAG: protein kinase domain-containing protein [Verrucomicrobiales bacterium]